MVVAPLIQYGVRLLKKLNNIPPQKTSIEGSGRRRKSGTQKESRKGSGTQKRRGKRSRRIRGKTRFFCGSY